MRDSDWIPIASFVNPRVWRRFRKELAAAGIAATVTRDGTRTRLDVRFTDRDKAFELMARQQRDYPDIVRPGSRRDYDFTFVLAVVGAFLGFPLLFISANRGVGLVSCLGAIVTGTVLGYFVDRAVRNIRYTGRTQFSLLDCLLLVFVAALLMTFWTTVARLF